MLRSADRPFIVVRGEALCLMCEEEARVVQMRPVEKAAPALSGPVGGSVSYVLGLDTVVLGDGGVSSGDMGRYASVGDVSLSCGCDMELCGVVTVFSGAVGGGLCDLDKVSGGGDTDVSGVDTVVSASVSGYMCDIDSVSPGGIVASFDDMSVSGGGDAVVSGVDETVYGVNSVMPASEVDMSGCNSLVTDDAGNSSGVEVVMSIDDAVRVGGWVSVVGDTLMCGAKEARSDRGRQ